MYVHILEIINIDGLADKGTKYNTHLQCATLTFLAEHGEKSMQLHEHIY